MKLASSAFKYFFFQFTVIVHAVPHAVLMPCALGVAYNGQCGQAWCVKWIPHSMHEKIATGFSDGKYHFCD